MWQELKFSSETIDNLKKEMQRLQDEGKRLLSEAKVMEQEEQGLPLRDDFSYVFQGRQDGKTGCDQHKSLLFKFLHH
jgi:hypothetical protein